MPFSDPQEQIQQYKVQKQESSEEVQEVQSLLPQKIVDDIIKTKNNGNLFVSETGSLLYYKASDLLSHEFLSKNNINKDWQVSIQTGAQFYQIQSVEESNNSGEEGNESYDRGIIKSRNSKILDKDN